VSADKFPVKRHSKIRYNLRAHYDRATVLPILDKALFAHVGLIIDDRPTVIPMAYARIDDTLYLHGAKATRLIKKPEDRAPACVTVTHFDGIVVARSAFHHSVNYRSVVVHGHIRKVRDDVEKEAALIAVTNHILPGRWEEVREMNAKEFKSTGVLAMDIETASAKIRSGPPVDEDDDYDLPIWAGILPVETGFGPTVTDERNIDGVTQPPSLLAANKRFFDG